MPETLHLVGVELFDVHRLRLTEAGAPRLSAEGELARDRVWNRAVEANPGLFDAPVVACAGVEWEDPHALLLSWARVTYRHYALRRVPGNTAWLPSLFVNVVQPTDDGRVLVARMSSSTAAPGRWQLPGGSVEPPEEQETLDEVALRRNAARELAEETGLDTGAEDLTLWAVTRGENRSIGLSFLAPPRPEAELRERFQTVTAAEKAQGREPELDRIALVRSAAELAELKGPHADYLEPIVTRFTDA
ncbi:NUDIX domain-containing protein [Streptomyces sp. NPDC003035]|uniref:NUDIX domain-containing protein n=1 Tax=Streptomyces sp. NPDC003035 TaxID=3364676 RepID=UPI00369A4C87